MGKGNDLEEIGFLSSFFFPFRRSGDLKSLSFIRPKSEQEAWI